jgi:hypothetical protein
VFGEFKEVTMGGAGRAMTIGSGLGLALAGWCGAAAQTGHAAYQGAWLSGSADCAEVYASAGKGLAFKKPVDIFAPAFIVSGSRLKTPQASCRIKSVRPEGTRQLLILDCENIVAGHEVRVLMGPQADGTLRRYLNAQDTLGTQYKQCSR